jgi:hypothetical protein
MKSFGDYDINAIVMPRRTFDALVQDPRRLLQPLTDGGSAACP